MPVVHATLGTSRTGERHVVVSAEVGEGVSRIEFPLDHVALAARRVGARSAAQLWAAAVDAAWQLAGGAALPDNACDNVRKVAARALGRLPSTSSRPVPIDVVSSRWEGDWVLEAISDLPIPAFEADSYQPHATIPSHSWRSRHWRDFAVGDRVHTSGELDGEVIDITSHRLGGGVILRLRTADDRVIHRRPPEVRHAPERDVLVAVHAEEHTIAARTEALGSSRPYRYGVVLLALVHNGCPCE